MLKVNNLQFSYKKNENILEDISFSLSPGKIYVLLGKNGAGKTTLLKCLSGMYDVNAGTIEKMSELVLIEDHPKLYYFLTGREYLELILTLNDGANKESLPSLVKDLDMAGALDKTIIDYSLGMKHKLALISAILMDYEVYLIDEPLTALDPQTSRFMIEYFKQLKKSGKTLLISTHMMHIAYELADEIFVLSNGYLKTYVNDFKEYSLFEEQVITDLQDEL